MSGNSLSLTQQQKLQVKLSPSQILMIRLLEVPVAELQQRIDEELQANPMLEEGIDETKKEQKEEQEEIYENPLQNEDFDYDDYVNDDEKNDDNLPILHSNNYAADDEPHEAPLVSSVSLNEYLVSQIYLTKMTPEEQHIAEFVVGNIDEDGYLRRDKESLINDLAFREGLLVSEEQMGKVLSQVQQFDPPGVGASTLQECLLIQLQRKPQTAEVRIAQKIVTSLMDEFAHKNIEKMSHRLNISSAEVREACEEIFSLNPKPGNAWSGMIYERNENVIIPDFIIENKEGELVLSLNNGDIPSLRVSEDYKLLLAAMTNGKRKTEAERETVRFMKTKIDAAKSFIDAITQRNETLYKTMYAIMQFQKEFFLEGDEVYLKPMILQDIAEVTGLDISTVSRVGNSKYVQTEFGIYPLKHFFSEAMTNDKGEEVSTREIKRILKDLIDHENKQKPLNDDKLVVLMKKYGYMIARRTIAKYRKLLNIPIASMRKRM